MVPISGVHQHGILERAGLPAEPASLQVIDRAEPFESLLAHITLGQLWAVSVEYSFSVEASLVIAAGFAGLWSFVLGGSGYLGDRFSRLNLHGR